MRGVPTLLCAQALLVGSDLYFIAAEAHAAPAAGTLLADIQKVHRTAFALADAARGQAGQQQGGVFGKRAEQIGRQARLEGEGLRVAAVAVCFDKPVKWMRPEERVEFVEEICRDA